MTRFHPEALLFALAWAALALSGGLYAGWLVGALLSVGLLVLVTGSSMIILSRYDNFAAERLARWGLLVVAALGLLLWLRAGG